MAALLDSRSWPFLPPGLRLKRQIDLLKRSGLFDAEWYLSHYRDVAEFGVDPVKHYIKFGLKEGRAPNATFAGLVSPVKSDPPRSMAVSLMAEMEIPRKRHTAEELDVPKNLAAGRQSGKATI